MVTFFYMKRLFFLLGLLTVLISNVSAQFSGDGFYRVQNFGTKRYLYLTDNTGSYDMKRDIGDFGALQLFQGQEKTISDPSSILYIKQYGSQIDIQGQSIGIYQIVKRYVDLKSITTPPFSGTYTVSATESGITKYLDDEEINTDIPDGVVGTNRGSPWRNWLIHPVNSATDGYFGISPLFSVSGKYYYPLYAAFPFKVASSGMRIYTVSKYDLELGYAVLSEITGIVPSCTPVLIECSSSSPSGNRLDLVACEDASLPSKMKGVMFCNYDRRNKSKDAITAYDEASMRVLGITSEGKVGFVKSTQYLKEIEGSYYLPSNISYMTLPVGSPNELTVIEEAEYEEILANSLYTVTYMIDGEVYKTERVKIGQPLNADNPTREGYNFSGWDGLPETMPANDITVSGYFTIGTYKLIYVIDGVEYQTQTYTYGDAITPLGNPTRDGYTFSGWSTIPTVMPGNDVVITGSYTPLVYTIQYVIDGQLYQEQQVPCGQTITPPTAPEKYGYHFKEWKGLPSAMTAGDLTVTAVYEPNIYNVIYVVDGTMYKTVEVAFGSAITLIDNPVKEGYKFSGWSQVPKTMPANDITVTGTFTIGTYKLRYVINGAGYKEYVYFSRDYKYGQSITAYSNTPSPITGYTFSGWGDIPATMPGHDVNVYGTYKGNPYYVRYYVGGKMVHQQVVACGDSIPAYTYRSNGIVITNADWQGTKYQVMPAKDVIYTCSQDIVDVINTLSADDKEEDRVMFDLAGRRISAMKSKGIYIVNGKKILKQ
jgi:hypothetical protein